MAKSNVPTGGGIPSRQPKIRIRPTSPRLDSGIKLSGQWPGPINLRPPGKRSKTIKGLR